MNSKNINGKYSGLLEELKDLRRQIELLHSMCRQELLDEEIIEPIFSVLVCQTDNETVGIQLKYVDEVVPMCATSSIPDSPAWLIGLLNLEGAMIPIIDLSSRIDNLRHVPTLSDFIVICTVKTKCIGLAVTKVEGVVEKKKDDLQLVAEQMIASPFLLGIADYNNDPMLLLSMSGLLSLTEASEDDSAHN